MEIRKDPAHSLSRISNFGSSVSGYMTGFVGPLGVRWIVAGLEMTRKPMLKVTIYR